MAEHAGPWELQVRVRVRVTCGGRAGWTLGATGEGEGEGDVWWQRGLGLGAAGEGVRVTCGGSAGWAWELQVRVRVRVREKCGLDHLPGATGGEGEGEMVCGAQGWVCVKVRAWDERMRRRWGLGCGWRG